MKKDIFIDNNIAKNFSNPMDKAYINLIKWLMSKNDLDNLDNNAHLVVSQKLLVEYLASNRNAQSMTNIAVLVALLQREGRLIHIPNHQIKDFQNKFFTKNTVKKLKSNSQDHEHIPVVLLSDRKMALSIDDNFANDLLNFKGFQAIAAKRPEELPYDL